MAEFLRQCWFLLLGLYQTIQGNGLTGCLIAFVLAIVMSKIGAMLTGRAERFTGTVQNGHAGLRRHPAVQDTAKSWLERLCGALLQTAAGVLFLVTVIATVNLLL